MTLVRDITSAIEAVAPLGLQESWDNSGLQVGHLSAPCKGVLLCVDATEQVVAEAIERGADLIVSHHPLIFKALKRVTGQTPQQRVIIEAIRHGISIYSCHTPVDIAPKGISHRMGTMLGLDHLRPLSPRKGCMLRLSVMVPDAQAAAVRLALFEAGAGEFGQYDMCSFNVKGQGTFRALDDAHPYVGDVMEWHTEAETRISVVLPTWLRAQVERALIEVHPYEEPAYEFTAIDNAYPHAGLGVVGRLPQPLSHDDFVALVKDTFHSPVTRCNRPFDTGEVQTIGLCGGSGSEFISLASSLGCDAYLTSDTRYHDLLDSAGDIFVVDIGHWEAEHCATQILADAIRQKFPTFALSISASQLNPITYR